MPGEVVPHFTLEGFDARNAFHWLRYGEDARITALSPPLCVERPPQRVRACPELPLRIYPKARTRGGEAIKGMY